MNFMSPKEGKTLIRYLALVHQVLIEILQDAGFLETSVHFKTQVFVKYTTKEIEWQPADITSFWCSAICDFFGCDTSIVNMCQMITGIYGKLFPTIRNSNTLRKGALGIDIQGDHGHDMDHNNYGRQDIFCFGNSGIEIAEFKLISGIWHVTGGVCGLDDTWPKEVLESPLFFNHTRAEQALDLA